MFALLEVMFTITAVMCANVLFALHLPPSYLEFLAVMWTGG